MTLTAVLQLAAAAVVLILSVPLLEKTYLFGQLEGLNRTLIAGTRVYLTSLLGEWSTFWQGSHTLFKNTPFPDLLLPLADTNSLLPWSLIGFGLLAALLINHLMLSGVNQNSPSSPHH